VQFLSRLTGGRYAREVHIFGSGQGVCVYLSEGNSLEDATGEVMKETGLGLEQSGFFVGAAAASYCPKYAP
jgi:Protein of unknown function (DUF732)